MFPTIATQLDPDKPAPRFVCPQCGSDNVRIAAVIDVVFKPNDSDDPFVDSEFIGLDCDWEDYSDAWFVAFTPGLVIGTHVGAFDPSVHFQSAHGTGGALALPIVGQVLQRIERTIELRGKYVRSFDWADAYAIDLDCDPRRERSPFGEWVKDVFRPKGSRADSLPAAPKKDKGFFDRLFNRED